MAQKTTVTLIDDLTGEEAQEISTVDFALDGVAYQIDLAEENADALRDALAEYVAASRRTGGRKTTRRRRTRRARGGPSSARSGSGYSREDLKSIREWAKQAGYNVSDRGRLPAEVVSAWEGQHKSGAAKTGGNGGGAPTFSG
ncbi:MAG: Lsr2 family protein [Pseudonocardiaceae bacterium]|nr:Lsr2 family protein [Pseudonocardiaceae bacterium]